MAIEARKFPKEVESFLNEIGVWGGLSKGAQTMLKGLGVKLEPFAVPQTIDRTINDIRGFECLAYGAGGAHYGALLAAAQNENLDRGVLGLTLFRVALLTANALVAEMGNRIPGAVWARLYFSINVDAPMLMMSAFSTLLDSVPRPAFTVLLEASEDLTITDVARLRVLLNNHVGWLKLALDDSDELAHDTRQLLRGRVELVKADGRYVRKLYRDQEADPDTHVISGLLKLCHAGKPFVAEGVESAELKRYLQDRWDVSANGELWMQGYHIKVPAPWQDVLRALTDRPDEPRGYVLPEPVKNKVQPITPEDIRVGEPRGYAPPEPVKDKVQPVTPEDIRVGEPSAPAELKKPPRQGPLIPGVDFRVKQELAESRALLIAVSKYQDPNVSSLPVAVLNDVDDLAALLTDPARCGFAPENVVILKDAAATKANIVQALIDLGGTADRTVLIYFSGHGGRPGRVDSGSCLCPTDYNTSLPASTGIPSAVFSELVSNIRSHRLAVILDACHSAAAGVLKDGVSGDTFKSGVDDVVDLLGQGIGRVILSSSSSDEKSGIRAGARNSLFTSFLLEGLRGDAGIQKDGVVRVLDLFTYVQQEVPRHALAGHPQHPVLKAELRDNFPLAVCPDNPGSSKSDPGSPPPADGGTPFEPATDADVDTDQRAFEDSLKAGLGNELLKPELADFRQLVLTQTTKDAAPVFADGLKQAVEGWWQRHGTVTERLKQLQAVILKQQDQLRGLEPSHWKTVSQGLHKLVILLAFAAVSRRCIDEHKEQGGQFWTLPVQDIISVELLAASLNERLDLSLKAIDADEVEGDQTLEAMPLLENGWSSPEAYVLALGAAVYELLLGKKPRFEFDMFQCEKLAGRLTGLRGNARALRYKSGKSGAHELDLEEVRRVFEDYFKNVHVIRYGSADHTSTVIPLLEDEPGFAATVCEILELLQKINRDQLGKA